ncbi:MAG: hypothetical protein BV457_03450 [Thermoplasmata archaeon M9B1D]|nr:MAG: hypothetical protein BV457_03450 [Thermoplasmata archaeon M9B1D]
MDAMGIDYIPSRSIIKQYNSAILSRIDRNGGILKLSEKFNIPMGSRVHWHKTSNEEIEEKIKEMISNKNMDKFPSRKEIIDYFGNSSIACIISRRGGFKFWSNKIGYEMKESETKTGWIGEGIAKELLENHGYLVEKMNTNCAYDFLVNGNIRIDIKFSRLFDNGNMKYYSFNLEQKFHDCDIYILICEDENKNIKVIVIPQSFVQNQGQIGVGEFKSKWYKYIDKYDFIDMYSNFYNKINKNKGE